MYIFVLHVHIHFNAAQILFILPFYRPFSQWCLGLLQNILACYTNLQKKKNARKWRGKKIQLPLNFLHSLGQSQSVLM